MIIHYDSAKLNRLINDFAGITGLTVAIVDPELNSVFESSPNRQTAFCSKIQECPGGVQKCRCSDRELLVRCAKSRQMVYHTCHAGLHDAVLPIFKDNILLGYIMLGAIRMTKSADCIGKNLAWMGDALPDMYRRFENLPIYTQKKFQSVRNLAVALATYIVTDSMIRIDFLTDVNNVVNYIEENLDKDLSVKSLCSTMHISKNTLYKNFRAAMNCTLNEFITARRIDAAKQLLSSSEIPITEISERIGLNNPTYFPKLFQKHTGMTPSQYRAEARKELEG